MNEERKWHTGMFATEDWWSFWIGLFFVVLGLVAAATSLDLTGWIIGFPKWLSIDKSLAADHPELLSGVGALVVSYIIFTVVTCFGAYAMKMNVKKYFMAWTIIFILTAIVYVLSRNMYVQGTSIDQKKYGLEWSLSIGGAHYIAALILGLIIGNLAPRRMREFLQTAARPEWFIKIAIVCLGTKLGLQAMEATGFAFELLIVGCCATIAAYMLFWPLVYTLGRKVFKLSREWSATMASGTSICGVSASVATGAAIRARPIVPVMVSSLVVVYAVFELVILPPVLTYTPWFDEPMAAAASIGLTVKTDGADAAAGAVTDELMRARAAEELGVKWQEGWITSGAVMTKIWIDMFIGIWAFVLAVVWLYFVERRSDEKVPKMEIWWRFPKFVLGYFVAWFAVMGLGLAAIISPEDIKWGVGPIEGAMRHLFFILTFTSIGLVTEFRSLAREGMGKLMIYKGLAMLIIIIPIGWILAWIFHHGMEVPLVK